MPYTVVRTLENSEIKVVYILFFSAYTFLCYNLFNDNMWHSNTRPLISNIKGNIIAYRHIIFDVHCRPN
jgi:hypothetical protein